MNVLTFDIEEWYLEARLFGGREFRYAQFDNTLDKVLEKLDEQGKKATFFCLGKMAGEYASVIRKIASCGHEIGCHSDSHNWLTKMTPEELREDTNNALHALEDLAGQKVTSYRAPAFSITPKNPWAVEVLAECGIETDASIFPAARDFGGYPTFPIDSPCRISYHGTVLKEFPVTIMSLLNKRIAFSGGGYFRLLPDSLVRREMQRRNYNICYFHLSDLIVEKKKLKTRAEYEKYFKEPGTIKNRLVRYVKSNIGSRDTCEKVFQLLTDFSLMSVTEASGKIAWEQTKLVEV